MYANKVMTYSQWQRRFKRALKKTIRKKIESIMWTEMLGIMYRHVSNVKNHQKEDE